MTPFEHVVAHGAGCIEDELARVAIGRRKHEGGNRDMKNAILAVIIGVMIAGCGGADTQSQSLAKAQSSTELAKGTQGLTKADVVKLFDAVPVTFTGKVTPGVTAPYKESGETSIYVDCGAGGSVTVGSLDATGNIGPFIVDNYFTVNGQNVCKNDNADGNCFSAWKGPSVDWMSLGDDDAGKFGAGFFEPPQAASSLYGTVSAKTLNFSGKLLLTFKRMDWGGVIGSTAIYMKTDGCKVHKKVSIVHFANCKRLCVGAAAIPAHVKHGDDPASIVPGCSGGDDEGEDDGRGEQCNLTGSYSLTKGQYCGPYSGGLASITQTGTSLTLANECGTPATGTVTAQGFTATWPVDIVIPATVSRDCNTITWANGSVWQRAACRSDKREPRDDD
jgi:hypothetical protein